ncbi:MAG: hypothetical protein NZ903_02030, partial [Candidatus Micrarchaeota archaeon]|nr:hypothetical protein [Candidatus Micrarchaeota archaeon]
MESQQLIKKESEANNLIGEIISGKKLFAEIEFKNNTEATNFAKKLVNISEIKSKQIDFKVKDNKIILYPTSALAFRGDLEELLANYCLISEEGYKILKEARDKDPNFGVITLENRSGAYLVLGRETKEFLEKNGFRFNELVPDTNIYELVDWPSEKAEEEEIKEGEKMEVVMEKEREEVKKTKVDFEQKLNEYINNAKSILDKTKEDSPPYVAASAVKTTIEKVLEYLRELDMYINKMNETEKSLKEGSGIKASFSELISQIKSPTIKYLIEKYRPDISAAGTQRQVLSNVMNIKNELIGKQKGAMKTLFEHFDLYEKTLKLCNDYIEAIKKRDELQKNLAELKKDRSKAKQSGRIETTKKIDDSIKKTEDELKKADENLKKIEENLKINQQKISEDQIYTVSEKEAKNLSKKLNKSNIVVTINNQINTQI